MPTKTVTEIRRTQQAAENAAYVRRLLRRKQPAFAEALELALMLAELAPACLPAAHIRHHHEDMLPL